MRSGREAGVGSERRRGPVCASTHPTKCRAAGEQRACRAAWCARSFPGHVDLVIPFDLLPVPFESLGLLPGLLATLAVREDVTGGFQERAGEQVDVIANELVHAVAEVGAVDR